MTSNSFRDHWEVKGGYMVRLHNRPRKAFCTLWGTTFLELIVDMLVNNLRMTRFLDDGAFFSASDFRTSAALTHRVMAAKTWTGLALLMSDSVRPESSGGLGPRVEDSPRVTPLCTRAYVCPV